MRNKIVVGNWKMNTTPGEGVQLLKDIISRDRNEKVNIGIASPYTHIHSLSQCADELATDIMIGAQDCSANEAGAYTGEVNAKMIKSCGAQFVLIGHSERRKYHGEKGELLFQKMNQALENGLHLIYCIGESLEERKAGKLFEVLKEQLEEGPMKIEAERWKSIALAYEPVWAIGTGETATPEQAQEVHAFLRKTIRSYSESVADSLSILYGGSCKPSNASALFQQKDIDGGLIGGASLKGEDFVAIINSF